MLTIRRVISLLWAVTSQCALHLCWNPPNRPKILPEPDLAVLPQLVRWWTCWSWSRNLPSYWFHLFIYWFELIYHFCYVLWMADLVACVMWFTWTTWYPAVISFVAGLQPMELVVCVIDAVKLFQIPTPSVSPILTKLLHTWSMCQYTKNWSRLS